jgi:Kef-type K+ transport system membrane component KefB/nucleotide-binding universal stress UspA family protein
VSLTDLSLALGATDVFTAPSHHDILALVIQIAILLFTARILGEIAQRLGQPSVVGEILAGIILGPSLISGLFPDLGYWIVPHNETQGFLLETVGLLGVMFLLLITGLETDIPLIRRQARSAIGVALGGLILPLLLGFALGYAIPDNLLVDTDERLVFALFLATAMAISAIPVVAKVLVDMNLTRRDVGQTIIAAAMIDDTTGWVILSIVIGLAASGAVTLAGVAQSVLSVVLFMALSFTVGQWLVGRLLRSTQENIISRDKVLSLIVLLMFVWGGISQALNLEALLGAFVLGILFSRLPRLDPNVVHSLESIALGIFAPIFFAIAGLKVNAVSLLQPDLFGILVAVTVVAVICKMVGVYIGARWLGGVGHWQALFFGSGLNARGSMGIIVANIGLTLGILGQDMFSIIVMMAVLTSLMAPFALRYTLRHIQPEQQELDRLRSEELHKDNLVANVHRILLPLRRPEGDCSTPQQVFEAEILQRIGRKTDLAVTLFNVANPGEEGACQDFLKEVSGLFNGQKTSRRVVAGEDVTRLILDEAKKDYDLVVMGASDSREHQSHLFTPLADDVVRLSATPTILVHAEDVSEDWQPRRILVPTNGSLASRRAADVAFALANGESEVFVLKVVNEPTDGYNFDASGTATERQFIIAHQITEELRAVGQSLGVRTFAKVRAGQHHDDVILDTAGEDRFDLIVLGTSVRPGSDRLYLGPRVERIVYEAGCPVLVVNTFN